MRLVARALEEGWLNGPVSRLAGDAWGRVAAARLVKPLAWRDGARVVAIGGATLGGSGKTPLAIACARALAEDGARVALVGHAYGARPERPRVVRALDDVREVGDEALVCARALAGVGALVVVAPARQAALDLALALADVAILDGVHQTAPRAALALLAVDADAPWGAGACPPRGDLRAPRRALVAAADLVVPVRGVSRGAFVDGALVGWDALRGLRLGLVTALARPGRVVRQLAAEGVHPAALRTFSDHRTPRLSPAEHAASGVDVWLTTEKCRASFRASFPDARIPLAVLDHQVRLPPACRLTLTRLGPYPPASNVQARNPPNDGARQARV